MSERARYITTDNIEVTFRDYGFLFLGQSDLRAFTNDIKSARSKIYAFKKQKLRSITLPVYLTSSNANIRNALFELFEKDIAFKNANPLSDLTGKLYIGDYYIPGFIYGSSPENYLTQTKTLKKQLQFVCAYPSWLKERNYSFGMVTPEETGGIDYEYDFEFDYGISQKVEELQNSSLYPALFKIVISGPVAAPSVNIGGNVYGADVVIDEGETLTIDAMNKKCFITRNDGKTINCLNERLRINDIFEPIPSGSSQVIANASFLVDLTLYEERSEPEWI